MTNVLLSNETKERMSKVAGDEVIARVALELAQIDSEFRVTPQVYRRGMLVGAKRMFAAALGISLQDLNDKIRDKAKRKPIDVEL